MSYSVLPSLDFQGLQASLQRGERSLAQWVEALRQLTKNYPDPSLWIAPPDWTAVLDNARRLEADFRSDPQPWVRFPLYGLPFAVKDNIDVAGIPTTAACPAFAYTPKRSATAVERLESAGALFIGKTNLDQFATGLVGTRSPYGAVRNAFHPDFVSGGSSSGSAVAVAAGLVSFALGTDTAGSGRIPAGFNNIVGLKPTRGIVSTRGVVPACRSLDCVSVFALTCEDAFRVLEVLRGEDAEDSFSRAIPTERILDAGGFTAAPVTFRFAVPRFADLQFFGNPAYARLFEAACRRLVALGGTRVEVSLEDFSSAARLLYQGPWVAERRASFGSFLDAHPDAVLPVIREVVSAGREASPESVFAAQYLLQDLKAKTHRLLAEVDVLVVPTAPTHPTLSEVEAEPIASNSRLGTYTNFVNLLDLSALSIPSGFQDHGLPFGITLIGLPFRDGNLASLGAAFQSDQGLLLGRGTTLPPPMLKPRLPLEAVGVAVAGLHLSGQPLNSQLTTLGARLRGTFKTAPCYQLYALRRGGRHFPGILRQTSGGTALDVEIWDLTRPALGQFLTLVKAPLVLGTLELADGQSVIGFLAEAYATEGAEDITAFGGWLAYRRSLS